MPDQILKIFGTKIHNVFVMYGITTVEQVKQLDVDLFMARAKNFGQKSANVVKQWQNENS